MSESISNAADAGNQSNNFLEPSLKNLGKNERQNSMLQPQNKEDGEKTQKSPYNSAGTASATGNPRNKVALKPGRSLLDWIRLGHSGKDLTSVDGKILQVTPEELMKHNERHDAWTCLRGKVYNITPYMEYHPGGEEELMNAAGKDATDLFNEIHNWVNADSMLQKCFVGFLNVTALTVITNPIMKAIRPSQEPTAAVYENPRSTEQLALPKFKWSQTLSTIILNVSVPTHISKESIVALRRGQRLTVLANFKDLIFYLDIEFEHGVEDYIEVNVSQESHSNSSVEIKLYKMATTKMWEAVGIFLPLHETVIARNKKELQYVKCILEDKSVVTHDTWVFKLRLPAGSRMLIPIGNHVHLQHELDGVVVGRNFTPVPPNLFESNENGEVIYLMIKIYKDGVFTQMIEKLHIGDSLEVSDYSGTYDDKILKTCKSLVLLAAGTGFTPMCELIRAALQRNTSKVKLIFFNKKQRDVLWRDQLDVLCRDNDKFLALHVLSEPDGGWTGEVGRIRAEILEPEIVEISSKELHVCVCGPTEFTQTSLNILTDLGIARSQIHAFMS